MPISRVIRIRHRASPGRIRSLSSNSGCSAISFWSSPSVKNRVSSSASSFPSVAALAFAVHPPPFPRKHVHTPAAFSTSS